MTDRFEQIAAAMPRVADICKLFPTGLQRAAYDDLMVELGCGAYSPVVREVSLELASLVDVLREAADDGGELLAGRLEAARAKLDRAAGMING